LQWRASGPASDTKTIHFIIPIRLTWRNTFLFSTVNVLLKFCSKTWDKATRKN
jgi:hypothetical protein